MNKIILILIACLFNFVNTKAQFAISGKLTSGSKQEIAATIRLYKDSILVQTTINDSTGYYLFNNVHSGSYKLTLSAVGYIKVEIDLNNHPLSPSIGAPMFR